MKYETQAAIGKSHGPRHDSDVAGAVRLEAAPLRTFSHKTACSGTRFGADRQLRGSLQNVPAKNY